eukprot:scaffold181760_cov29-Tisochrysis_lutea.AAC.3
MAGLVSQWSKSFHGSDHTAESLGKAFAVAIGILSHHNSLLRLRLMPRKLYRTLSEPRGIKAFVLEMHGAAPFLSMPYPSLSKMALPEASSPPPPPYLVVRRQAMSLIHPTPSSPYFVFAFNLTYVHHPSPSPGWPRSEMECRAR